MMLLQLSEACTAEQSAKVPKEYQQRGTVFPGCGNLDGVTLLILNGDVWCKITRFETWVTHRIDPSLCCEFAQNIMLWMVRPGQ